MSGTIKVVSANEFADKAWKPFTDYNFAASSLICPVAGEELAHAAQIFPLAFVKGEQQTTLVALMGLAAQRNLYVGPDGKWLGAYVPAMLRSHPFRLVATEGNQLALGYDEGSGLLVSKGQGEPFFGDDGQAAPRTKDMLEFLVRLKNGHETTARAAAELLSHDVLEPWPLTVRDGERELPVEGIWRVSEAKLAALPDEAFLALRRGNALAVAYAQLLSTVNISALGQLADIHLRHAAMVSKQQEKNQPIFAPPAGGSDTINWDMILKDNGK